ncbi:MAG: sugar nucleotide-binding protein [Flavisolibacter sp.]|nr:sugar nucleotide-binding protein [Flavisolibacter sp.]
MEKQYCKQPEIWGGIECTINRVKNRFFDQLHYSGHYYRSSDILELSDLGIKKMRYPVLWEKHQPEETTAIDWTWTEGQLKTLRDQNIDVIAGLVHHGSGPSFTNLADPLFGKKLSGYARAVAEKFPWLEYYTPINEPLTTARFSGLYGIWYPHKKSARSFFMMLLQQLKGTVLSMQEIRKINPEAKLIQTEDLGKTYSTDLLKYQAHYENERRWLTFDLLCGKFDHHHILWNHFQDLDIPNEDLEFFLSNPCPPDIFGFNHYLTSERYIDERLALYPEHTHGSNVKHRYADVEAVRVQLEEATGIEVLLREAWQRFKAPMAITEVHLHCHREEQIKWFKHVNEAAIRTMEAGIDIKGITTWAMLGSFGWNKLLTQNGGDYEPGAFDVSGGKLRPTALASYIKDITKQNANDHPLAKSDGWWQRSCRIAYGPTINPVPKKKQKMEPIIIIGKNGTLGKAFARICEIRCLPYKLISRNECDISNAREVESLIDEYQPWAVINAAGFVRVDDAEKECEPCFRDNCRGPELLAAATNKKGIRLLGFSSDLVFNGKKKKPYLESDPVHPLNVYGMSKADAERSVLTLNPNALMVRTSAFFGPWDEYNFAHYIKTSLEQENFIPVVSDILISPTYVPDLVHASLDLLIDSEKGIWHLANKTAVSWYEFALKIAACFELDSSLLNPVPAELMNYAARRPVNSVLGSEKGQLLPSLEDALERFKKEKAASDGVVAVSV